MVEEPCEPGEARGRWAAARARGATGAVTSWGAGMRHRRTIRLYWEAGGDGPLPDGEDLAEENWTPYWRNSLSAVAVTDRITLVPAWEEPPPGVPCPIRIDPGMAFGAGDHPTTRLCVRHLERAADAGPLPGRVLDVGTGTGVLALAAVALGAGRVTALDIDPFGFAACRRNARINGVEGRVVPVLRSLDLEDGRYPLVLANIVGSQLRSVARNLAGCLEPGGRLVVSGFQQDEEDEVMDALGLEPVGRTEEDGWVAAVVAAGGGA